MGIYTTQTGFRLLTYYGVGFLYYLKLILYMGGCIAIFKVRTITENMENLWISHTKSQFLLAVTSHVT